MKKWQPLKVGDIVDIVAPGFAVTEDKLRGAVEFIEKLGLKPRVPQDIFGTDVICSNSDIKRFDHLKKALLAKDSRAVWCLRGGYGALRLVEKVAKLPKPAKAKLFVGYSDATTLHNLFNQYWGWATVHGPLLDRLGQHSLPLEHVNELIEVVFGVREKVEFKNLMPLNSAARKKGSLRGAIVGGNLAVTQTHIGTKFCRVPKGQILVFEDTGERGYKVDKMLLHLEMAGYFKGVKAIVMGEFVGGQETGGESLVNPVIKRFAMTQKIPVFSGLEVGHGGLQRALPLGTNAVLTCGSSGALTAETGAALK